MRLSPGVGTLKITVGCLTSTYPSIRTKASTRVGLLAPRCKKKAVGTSTRAGVCAFTGAPQSRFSEFTSL